MKIYPVILAQGWIPKNVVRPSLLPAPPSRPHLLTPATNHPTPFNFPALFTLRPTSSPWPGTLARSKPRRRLPRLPSPTQPPPLQDPFHLPPTTPSPPALPSPPLLPLTRLHHFHLRGQLPHPLPLDLILSPPSSTHHLPLSPPPRQRRSRKPRVSSQELIISTLRFSLRLLVLPPHRRPPRRFLLRD